MEYTARCRVSIKETAWVTCIVEADSWEDAQYKIREWDGVEELEEYGNEYVSRELISSEPIEIISKR